MESEAAQTGPNDADKMSGRRRACDECKQQKLRCDLASEDATTIETCSRCARLHLECKIDHGFQRKRKRRRSADLENEIRELREQLDPSQYAPAAPVVRDWAVLSATPPSANGALPISFVPPPVAHPSSIHTDASPATSAERIDGPSSHVPGLTTRPSIDEHTPRRSVWCGLPRPRAVGNIVLSVDDIEDLFNIYTTYYHPFLPLINTIKSPHEYFESSELLFWSIISVASRRLSSQPTLLPKLARHVTELTWRTLRSIPYTLSTVQALALLCTWPFPTSSSTADPTFMFVGLMLQIATQMGLHRALDAQDFAKKPTRLDALEYTEWMHTWASCNVVAQSVSFGCGLPLLIQTHDWGLAATSMSDTRETPNSDLSFRWRLRIEHFRHRVSSYLGSHVLDTDRTAYMQERVIMYRLLNSEFTELERYERDAASLANWHIVAARLHLHAFYLFDDATTDDYHDRIISLYLTASSLVKLSLDFDVEEGGFFHYCPFASYQVFVCAAFVILKILMNGFFRTILDVNAGTKLLEAAIAALRKMSVVNNDLPARLGEVLSYFCAAPDPMVIGGLTIGDLRLRQVRSRMSMSVVYDCLWTWRKQFHTENNKIGGSSNLDTGVSTAPYEAQNTQGFDFASNFSNFLETDMLF